jgi:hypothetical protein
MIRNKARVVQLNKFNGDPALFHITHTKREWLIKSSIAPSA